MASTTIQLYNTMTGKLEAFEPRVPGHVGIYVCGPTPYNVAHAGHARANLAFDVLVRHLRARGYQVTFVRNLTDVDDKILPPPRPPARTHSRCRPAWPPTPPKPQNPKTPKPP